MPAEKVAASPRRDGGDGRLPAVRTRRGKGSEGQGPVQKTPRWWRRAAETVIQGAGRATTRKLPPARLAAGRQRDGGVELGERGCEDVQRAAAFSPMWTVFQLASRP